MTLPEGFVRRMRRELPDGAEELFAALSEAPALGIRVNPLKPGAAALAEEYLGDPVPWAASGFYRRDASDRAGATLAHALGAFYLQEASAMATAEVLGAREGEVVLDLCAAPGGKSTQLASALRGTGALVSNEPVPARAKMLAENLSRWGAVNAAVVSAWPEALAKRWPETFDAVLCDAPCSGEGMFRREPDALSEWSEGAPEGCARRQADILDAAAKMVKPGGRLAYSTCTFAAIEDEEAVAAFLTRHPEFHPEAFELPGVGPSTDGCIRLWPHLVCGDGHFAALLRKDDAPARRSRPPKEREDRSLRDVLRRVEETAGHLPETLEGARLARFGDHLHALPKEMPPLTGLTLFRAGLSLAEIGRSHIRPSFGLSAGGERWLARPVRVRELNDDEAQLLASGGTLTPGEIVRDGWTLCVWRGMSVGFVKRNDCPRLSHRFSTVAISGRLRQKHCDAGAKLIQ